MICWRRLILGLISALFFAGIVRADMVPVFKLDAERQQPIRVCGEAEVRHTNLSYLYNSPIVDSLSLGTIQFLPKTSGDIDQSTEMPHTIELTGGPGSANLCLYALLSLGLYSVPHWIKRLHLVHIPQLCHDGGPFQIGYSFAATPESFCTLQVCYLDPPNKTAEDALPLYRQRTIISLWRKSQFTPETIASRGPPAIC